MPILHISIDSDFDEPVREPSDLFSAHAGVPAEFVTVNVVRSAHHSGNAYRAMVNLVLPDLLLPEARERMLRAAIDILEPCFNIPPEHTIAWLTVVPSRSVIDRGQLQEWENEPPEP